MHTRSRGAILAIALLLFGASCRYNLVRSGSTPSPRPTKGAVGDPSATIIPSAAPTPSPAASGPGAPPGDYSKINDFGEIGDASRQILRPSPFTEIVLEVDFLADLEPNQKVISNIVSTLKSVTGKKVTLEGANQMTPTRSGCYSSGDIGASASARTTSSEGRRASIFVFYLNVYFCDNERALGASTHSTIAAIFPETFRGKGGVDAAVEETVLLHHIGHILGLVNFSYRGIRPHHDGNGHSTNTGSVMHASADIDFKRRTPLGFDDNDKGDLADLASGKL